MVKANHQVKEEENNSVDETAIFTQFIKSGI